MKIDDSIMEACRKVNRESIVPWLRARLEAAAILKQDIEKIHLQIEQSPIKNPLLEDELKFLKSMEVMQDMADMLKADPEFMPKRKPLKISVEIED